MQRVMRPADLSGLARRTEQAAAAIVARAAGRLE